MCQIPNITVTIKSLDFNMRGKFCVKLSDGRQILVPIGLFPEIKNLSIKERNEWMILDHQYFTFQHLSRIYSILDIMSTTDAA